MRSALVTGGAGFIGSHLVEALLARGVRVTVLDDFSTGRAANLEPFRTHPDLVVVRGDVRDPAALARVMPQAEVVFHLAAFVSVPGSIEDPLACMDINEHGTGRVLEAARQAGVRRVVLVSSAAVYGDHDARPLHEDLPPRALSPYAASKIANEALAQAYTHMGLPTVALRLFNVYGPRQRTDSSYAAAIPLFVERLRAGQPPVVYGDGRQTRDFVFVSDVVDALLAAADAAQAPGRAYNVCTGQAVSVLDLLAELYRFFPHAPDPEFAPPRAGDIRHSVGDPGRAARELGFRTRVSLPQGLRRLLQQA
ncbi:MAG: NAD-dependent epimerase/dehydratase family protein [Chloroflexi bacterium]|nr:NAD-dependent epimerase/dehydratase family protein [Chloroflexota bacterium]